ncbi:MAG TPA: LL-diaminopimelate aminotransferase [Candidatus Ruminococcus gallistercoris]|nr:LL-diaminopimelate aminotransferase [Candidatus Ruminococcus gallistercoris]
MQINTNYANLQDSYLFLTIAKKVAAYTQAHPENRIIRMGIGDVTQPLVPAVIEAMHKATDEMAHKETFHGYSPDQGYDFLREAIQGYYAKRGVSLKLSEIFVGDGAKSDIGNIVDIFGEDNRVLIPDPVYPVYVDTNVMSGRKVTYLDANERNGFLGMPDENTEADIIYLCSPNNPTGAVYSRAQLEAWVDYALRHEAVILFDAAYESFIADDTLPHSIFEIEGAKKCAIEFCSFSKTAGFTGVRCGYTVIADELVCGETQLNRLWARRQATKFNGVNYITQRAAAAVFTEAGQKQVREVIDYYRRNAALMVDAFKAMGLWFTGGENSPYIWHKVPVGMTSWEFFDDLLARAEVVGTPGSGFGRNGEGFFRLTAFGTHEDTAEAMERLKKLFK